MPQTVDRDKPRSARLAGLENSVRQCDMDRWSPRQESNLHLALRRHLFYPLNYGEMDIFSGCQAFWIVALALPSVRFG